MQALSVLYVQANNHYDAGKTIGSTFKYSIHEYQGRSPIDKSLQIFYNSKLGRQLYDQYLDITSNIFPEVIEEIKGIADGAGLSFEKIFLHQLASEVLCIHEKEVTDLQENGNQETGRCTDVLVNNREFRMIAHNEDWDKEVKELAFFVHVTIENEQDVDVHEEFASFVFPGELPGPTFGMNKHLVLTVNTLLPENVNRKSVPVAILLRKLLTCTSLDDCVKMMENKPNGCAYGINVNIASIHGNEMGTLEVYPEKDGSTSVSLKRMNPSSECESNNYYYHFNHYLHTPNAREVDSIERSKKIEARAKQLEPPSNSDDVRRILGDEDDPDVQIYKNPRPENTSKGSRTVATAVFDISKRKLHIYKSSPSKKDRPSATIPFL